MAWLRDLGRAFARVTLRLLVSGLVGFGLVGCEDDRIDVPQPDAARYMVLILVDDLRFDALGVTGHPFFRSPSIDRLALEGARFEDAFVVTSLCSPSRASVLTGKYAHEHGVQDIYPNLDRATPTFVTSLHDAGYRTAWIGKWHLASSASPFPGFDRWVSFVAQGSYANPILDVDGQPRVAPGHMTDILTEEALRFLDEMEAGSPFFLALSHLAVHTPYIPQPRFAGTYADAPITFPPSVGEDLSDKPSWLECRRTTIDPVEASRGYFDLLAGVEESVGLILQKLEDMEILDETLIVFASDNGYQLGEHGLGDKRTAYEESLRIPLFVRYPRWFPGGTVISGTLTLNLDIGATFLDGAQLPPLDGSRGRSLREQAHRQFRRDRFLYSYERDVASGTAIARCQPTTLALRTRDFTLIRYLDAPGEIAELYDLRSDRFQLENRYYDPAYAPPVEALSRVMERERRTIGYPEAEASAR